MADNMYNYSIEEAVLGTLITSGPSYNMVSDILEDDSFYLGKNKVIFRAVRELSESGKEKTVFTVFEKVKALSGGNEVDMPYIASITSKSVFSGLRDHACILSELSRMRKLSMLGLMIESMGSSKEKNSEEIMSEIQSRLDEIKSGSAERVVSLGKVIEQINDKVSKNMSDDHMSEQTLTGFREIDRRGGFRPTDLIVIGGESSVGKTSLANSIALSAMANGKKIAFYSMEMSKEQLVSRLLSIRSSMRSNKIMYERLSADELRRFDDAANSLMRFSDRLYFDDRSTSSLDEILNSIRNMKARYDIDGVIIDYMQILGINMRGVNQEQMMGDAARRLKNIAKQLNIWVLALSQLNRDSSDPIPNINRLRSSGQIAEASDTVLLIYRPEMYGRSYPEPFSDVSTSGTAMISIAKGRNFGTGQFVCGFDNERTYYYELESMPRKSSSEPRKIIEIENTGLPF